MSSLASTMGQALAQRFQITLGNFALRILPRAILYFASTMLTLTRGSSDDDLAQLDQKSRTVIMKTNFKRCLNMLCGEDNTKCRAIPFQRTKRTPFEDAKYMLYFHREALKVFYEALPNVSMHSDVQGELHESIDLSQFDGNEDKIIELIQLYYKGIEERDNQILKELFSQRSILPKFKKLLKDKMTEHGLKQLKKWRAALDNTPKHNFIVVKSPKWSILDIDSFGTWKKITESHIKLKKTQAKQNIAEIVSKIGQISKWIDEFGHQQRLKNMTAIQIKRAVKSTALQIFAKFLTKDAKMSVDDSELLQSLNKALFKELGLDDAQSTCGESPETEAPKEPTLSKSLIKHKALMEKLLGRSSPIECTMADVIAAAESAACTRASSPSNSVNSLADMLLGSSCSSDSSNPSGMQAKTSTASTGKKNSEGMDLPPGWKMHSDKEGKAYFAHENGTVQWTLPTDGFMPQGWKAQKEPDGATYYYNDKKCTWTHPCNIK